MCICVYVCLHGGADRRPPEVLLGLGAGDPELQIGAAGHTILYYILYTIDYGL